MDAVNLRRRALHLVAVQGMAGLVVTAFLFCTASTQFVLSYLLGVALVVLPNLVFVYVAFSITGARAAKKVVNRFFLGEAIKFFLTIAGFIAVFVSQGFDALALFLGFFATQLVHWVAALFLEQPKID